MKHCMTFMIAGLLLAGGASLQADDRKADMKHTAAKAAKGKPDVTYGRVKELNAGQKVVIDVDNAVDKSFDLNDKDLAVKLAAGLKVGDPVKVTEHTEAGITKRVQITKHAGGGVKHGDKSRTAEHK